VRTPLLGITALLVACGAQTQDAPVEPVVAVESSVEAPKVTNSTADFNAELREASRVDHDYDQTHTHFMQTKPIDITTKGDVDCYGDAVQGGLIICQLPPGATYTLGGKAHAATGPFSTAAIIGLDRDAPASESFTYKAPDTPVTKVSFNVVPRDWDISRIDGLPKNMVSEYTEEELARIRRASARKRVGFASNVDEMGFLDGFINPIPAGYTKTTNFGAQRVLNGEPKRPHYGVDLAAPAGTPIIAPADGIVSLADDDMYFEGSLIMIDHGRGLLSYYLHSQKVLVEDGQTVRRGDQIATVGSRGRSTGPHLCWRLKWHGRNLDPELLMSWIDG